MRIAAIVWCSAVPGLQVYLFRRIRDDLNKNHMEGPKGFRAMLAGWVAQGWCTIVEDEIRFWNGSKIYLCHCKDEKDIYKYQGAEIHVLLIDELTHFTEDMYRFLRNRVRMVGVVIPKEYAGRFPRILCGANPGNIGHLWVKSTFVTAGQPMELRMMPANDGGMLRQYIPARLEDNPSMTADDPGYEMRLEGLGSAALVQAMRWGDWDVLKAHSSIAGIRLGMWSGLSRFQRIGRCSGLGTGALPNRSRLAGGVWSETSSRPQPGYGCREAASFDSASGTGCSQASRMLGSNCMLMRLAAVLRSERPKILS
jgi:hypothetical protein